MAIDESMYATVEGFLHEQPRLPRLVALGEPLHGEETFPRLRNDLLRRFVEREGCRCVALESDCLAGRMVDGHVHGDEGHGDVRLDRVMAEGFSHGFGDSPANRALVEWIGERNRVEPPAGRVRFAGFDAPMEFSGARSPREALGLLHSFLAAHCTTLPHGWSRIDDLLGDDDRWTNPDAMMDPSQSIGGSDQVRELRAITDDLGWLLTSRTPHLAADASAEALREAELAARTAAGLLAYHRVWARTDHEERLTYGLGIRDAMMAGNLQALAARERDRGPVLVHAHNEHLRRGPARWRFGGMDLEWSPAGAHLARAFGPQYVVIATAIGAAPHLGIGPPPANTVEGVLAAAAPGPRLVPSSELAWEIARFGAGLTSRTTENHGYIPLGPENLDGFDAVLFLPHIDPPDPAGEAS